MKVLIVDDDPIIRKLLGHYLDSSGYKTLYASNGLEALEALVRDNVNLVLTDLNMPYMDGIELVKHMRDDEKLRNIPVLMVTTEDDIKTKELAMKTGVNGYLIKPVTAEAVTKEAKRLLKEIFIQGGEL